MTRVLTFTFLLALSGVSPGRAESAGRHDGALTELRALLAAGHYEAADSRAEALASSPGASEGTDAIAIRQLRVETRLRNGRGADPETVRLARALAKSAVADGANHRLLGEALFESGDYRAALPAFLAAEGLDRAAVGATSPALVEDLEGAAMAHLWLDHFQAASDVINRAVRIEETRPAGAGLARALTTRAFIRHRRGEYLESRSDLVRALDIRQIVGIAHPDSIAVLTLSGDQLWFDSDLAGARSRLMEAVALGERTLRAGHPALTEPLHALGITLDDLGELDLAQQVRERAVHIAAEAYGVDHPQYAVQLHDLSLSFTKRGDYREGRRLLQEALSIFQKRLGPTHSDVGGTLHNLGVLAASLGSFGEAASLQARAVSTWERSLGADHPWVPWALVAAAEALASRGQNAAALPLLARALAIRERLLGPDHIQVAVTLNVQARSFAALRRPARARDVIDRAIGLWEHSDSAEGLSDALLIRGRLEAAGGDYRRAQSDYERSLALRLPVFGAAHPSIGEVRVALAGTLAGLNRPSAALAIALDGERIGREHIRLTTGYLPEPQALDYAASRARGLDLALTVARTPVDVSQTFDALVRGRALVQDEMALRQRLLASTSADDLRPLFASLTAASRRLANLAVRGPGGDDGAGYAALLERARRDRTSAEAALAERSATARRELTRRDAGLDDLRAALLDATAIVSYVRYDAIAFGAGVSGAMKRTTVPSYAAFVLTPGRPDAFLVRLGPAVEIDAAIRRWRNHALASVTPAGDVLPGSEASLRTAGATLRARIWDPLTPALSDVSSIYIVPDGALNLVPFGALPIGRTAYLVDGAPLHYLSAERDLVEYAQPARSQGKGLLAVGGPDYGALAPRSPSPIRLKRAPSEDAVTDTRRSNCTTLDSMAFAALPASRREAEEVGSLWRALAEAEARPDADVLTGRHADEGTFKTSSPGHLVLHVATHGFFLGSDCAAGTTAGRGVVAISASASRTQATARARPIENPLLLSGLALARANLRDLARPDDEDGILTAEEVAALDLDGVEWAVLSACDSGLGQIRGGEGVFGLRRAFKIAGARTVIMSLWPVEDRATRVWMRALYSARLQARRSTADAMRDASLTVLADRRTRKLSTHPFFWAGFVAAGDWR